MDDQEFKSFYIKELLTAFNRGGETAAKAIVETLSCMYEPGDLIPFDDLVEVLSDITFSGEMSDDRTLN